MTQSRRELITHPSTMSLSKDTNSVRWTQTTFACLTYLFSLVQPIELFACISSLRVVTVNFHLVTKFCDCLRFLRLVANSVQLSTQDAPQSVNRAFSLRLFDTGRFAGPSRSVRSRNTPKWSSHRYQEYHLKCPMYPINLHHQTSQALKEADCRPFPLITTTTQHLD